MICSICGSGNVEWKGPLVALTHTECADCGGTNCQEAEPEPCRYCNGSQAIYIEAPEGSWEDACPECGSLAESSESVTMQ